MSREYLYKAKHVNWRELPKEEWWVEGDLIHEPYGIVIQYYKDGIKDKGNCAKTSKKKRIRAVVDPETVCEYTQITDKNDKKIFEADIAKLIIGYVGGAIRQYTCCVSFDEYGVAFENVRNKNDVFLYGEDIGKYDIEVISNIFDNPELLE